jgi:hypothetical protein
MSTNYIVQMACDVCGKRAPDQSVAYLNSAQVPEGWRKEYARGYLFCSIECARQRHVAEAVTYTEKLFAPEEEVLA